MLETLVGTNSTGQSRSRIKTLVKNLTKKRKEIEINKTPIQEVLLKGTSDPMFSYRMKKAVLDHSREM